MKKSILIYLSIFFLYSCGNNEGKGNSYNEIFVPVDDMMQNIHISDISLKVDYLKLDTDDEILINEITKIVTNKNYIYVSDGMSLFQFTDSGKFVNKINNQGGGPEEYIRLTDFDVNNDGTVWILCRNNKSLYKYNESSLLKKITLEDWVSNITLIDNDNMLLYVGNEMSENNKWQLKKINLKDHQIENYIPIDENKSHYLHVKSPNHFVKHYDDKSMVFFQIFNDTIYKFRDDYLVPYYYFNFGGKNIPNSLYADKYGSVIDFFERLNKNSYAYGTDFFYENEEVIYFSFIYDKSQYLTRVYKNNEKHPQIFKTITTDKILNNYIINLIKHEFFLQKDGKLIIPLYPFMVAEHIQDKFGELELKKFEERINYSDDMNPFLVIINLNSELLMW